MTKLAEDKPQAVTQGDMRHHNTRGMLLSFVERYERLTEEIDALGDDRKEVMAEAKGTGFDTKILREVIRRRKANSADIQEHDAVLELYEVTIKEAEKAQLKQSEAKASDPPAPKPAEVVKPAEAPKDPAPLKGLWGRKPAAPAPEPEVAAPTNEEVNAVAAEQIGRAADGKDEMPSFLRRNK